MMAIRDELRGQSHSSSIGSSPSPLIPTRYISSQYLADSSLSTDVSQYDFTIPLPPLSPQGGSTTGIGSNDTSEDSDTVSEL